MERAFELDNEIIIVTESEMELWIGHTCAIISAVADMDLKCKELIAKGYHEI